MHTSCILTSVCLAVNVSFLTLRTALDKFDSKSDEGIFVGYSTRSKAYRVFKKRTSTVEESLHVTFEETLSSITPVDDDEHLPIMSNSLQNIHIDNKIGATKPSDVSISELPKAFAEAPNHPQDRGDWKHFRWCDEPDHRLRK